MSLSSASGSRTNNAEIEQQVKSSSPYISKDAVIGKENQQINKIKGKDDTTFSSDLSISKDSTTNKASKALSDQALEETNTSTAAGALNLAEKQAVLGTQSNKVSSTNQVDKISSIKGTKELTEIQQLVQIAVKEGFPTGTLDKPSLPQPQIKPTNDMEEIAMAFARSMVALNDTSVASLENYRTSQELSMSANKSSLAQSKVNAAAQKDELEAMKKVQAAQKQQAAMNTANTVMMAVGIALTVLSIIIALFTFGAGLALGGAAAAATAATTTTAATATATATAATTAATTTVTSAATTAATAAAKTAVTQVVKEAVKQSIKQAIKKAVKAALKKMGSILAKLKNTQAAGKSFIKTSAPKASKAINALSSKSFGVVTGIMLAIPSLAAGIGSLDLSSAQTELAKAQKASGKASAETQQNTMFTKFWEQATRIAAGQTKDSNQLQEEASKTFASLAKAYRSAAQGLAAAV